MSRIICSLLIAALAIGALALDARADAWWNQKDVTSSVPVSFTVSAGTSLSLTVRNVSDNAVADSVTFNYVAGAKYSLARQYIEMNVSSNYSSWTVATYTDNGYSATSSSDKWGGLVGQDTSHRIPLLWTARDNHVSESSVPALNDTQINQSQWIWYVDKGNWDYASVAADTSTMYTTVLFGSSTSVDFNFGFGSGVGAPVAFYVGGSTANALPDAYSTRLYFDLLHL